MPKLSTNNLELIPIPIALKQICKSISAMEAIISPEWSNRYYTYQKNWTDSAELCEMRDGSGNQLLIIFDEDSVLINGFALESKMNGQSDILSQLPQKFNEYISCDPIKNIGSTFCVWQTENDNEWQIGSIEFSKDGSSELLQLLDGLATTFKNWAEGYYEIELELKEIEKIYNNEVLTKEIAIKINPKIKNFDQLKSDLYEIGYKNNL